MIPRRRQRPLHWIAACLLACATGVQAAPALFDLEQAGLDAGEIQATRALLDEAVSSLPSGWTQSLGPIAVEWREDLPAHVHGRALGGRMLLQRALLDSWMARDSGTGAAEAPAPALAAVIHELAHFHDRSAAGGLSHDPRLLDLAGWQVRPFRILPRLGDSAFIDRSPDPYELEDPAEFVAVNLEHFVLDPAYACRRPALAAHFAAHFGQPVPQGDCAAGLPFLDPGAEAGDPLLELDPERVYEVDYLLAEGNERFMSRWGHSMLRLVVCAPGRPPGPDCRLDLAHHRVLSFRAFVGDVQISNWRGLTGSYPSRLFVLPLDQVVEEYTRVELRGLISLPLRLSHDEVAGLLQRAAQLHWSYDGSYRFIGNNCAVETFKLLHDGVPRLAGERLASITPTGLMRRLQRAGLVDATVLEDADEAARLGYRFEPLSAHYAELFDTARQALDLPYARAEDWLQLPPGQRTGWLRLADLRSGAALLLLEQAALRRQELLARDELKRRFLGGGGDPEAAADAVSALRDLLQLEGLLTRPAALLPGTGYGLPQQAERETLEAAAGRHVAQWHEDGDRLQDLARDWLPPETRAALEGGEANLALLGERLRALHREQGGLEL
ncbi:MAG: DUF7844 domain-containing protein [Luteimonas sp.]